MTLGRPGHQHPVFLGGDFGVIFSIFKGAPGVELDVYGGGSYREGSAVENWGSPPEASGERGADGSPQLSSTSSTARIPVPRSQKTPHLAGP